MLRTWLWRAFWLVVIIAVLDYIAKDPTGVGTKGAHVGHQVITWVSAGLTAIVTFVTSLFS